MPGATVAFNNEHSNSQNTCLSPHINLTNYNIRQLFLTEEPLLKTKKPFLDSQGKEILSKMITNEFKYNMIPRSDIKKFADRITNQIALGKKEISGESFSGGYEYFHHIDCFINNKNELHINYKNEFRHPGGTEYFSDGHIRINLAITKPRNNYNYIIEDHEITPENLGGKGRSFLLFDALDMRYPEIAGIPPTEVRAIANGDVETLNNVVDELMNKFPNIGKNDNETFSIRSSPLVSMPGGLSTILNFGIIKKEPKPWNKDNLTMLIPSNEVKQRLAEAIKTVAESWENEKSKVIRKQKGIPEEHNMAILMQKMVFGDLDYRSASGVAYSSNPNTGKKEMTGSFLIETPGIDLVSGKTPGQPINELEKRFPEAYAVLKKKIYLLEELTKYPQEVEFVIEKGEIYFLQTRDIEFAPQVEAAYLQQLVDSGKASLMQVIPRMEKIQSQTKKRKVYKVKNDIQRSFIGKGITSTPGAMQGEVVWGFDKARQLNSEGKGAIVVIWDTNKDLFKEIFKLDKVGVITAYGDISAHETVLLRLAGIPAIVNIQRDGKCMSQLEAGSKIVLDGDNNELFKTDIEDSLIEDTSVYDASFGIDLMRFEEEFSLKFFGLEGRSEFLSNKEINAFIRDDMSLSKLLVLNELALMEYFTLDKKGQRKAAFVANLVKHCLHKLLILKQKQEGEEESSFRDTVNKDDLLLFRICNELIDKGAKDIVPIANNAEKWLKSRKRHDGSIDSLIRMYLTIDRQSYEVEVESSDRNNIIVKIFGEDKKYKAKIAASEIGLALKKLGIEINFSDIEEIENKIYSMATAVLGKSPINILIKDPKENEFTIVLNVYEKDIKVSANKSKYIISEQQAELTPIEDFSVDFDKYEISHIDKGPKCLESPESLFKKTRDALKKKEEKRKRKMITFEKIDKRALTEKLKELRTNFRQYSLYDLAEKAVSYFESGRRTYRIKANGTDAQYPDEKQYYDLSFLLAADRIIIDYSYTRHHMDGTGRRSYSGELTHLILSKDYTKFDEGEHLTPLSAYQKEIELIEHSI